MGGLGVWAVALLLGTSGCWLAEGHKGSKRGSAGPAEVSTQSPRSTVSSPRLASHGGHQEEEVFQQWMLTCTNTYGSYPQTRTLWSPPPLLCRNGAFRPVRLCSLTHFQRCQLGRRSWKALFAPPLLSSQISRHKTQICGRVPRLATVQTLKAVGWRPILNLGVIYLFVCVLIFRNLETCRRRTTGARWGHKRL